ncbi:hypothetical protein [Ferrimonas balearica]|uniref:hypothetical protein n=1 Tax=Ferrimonas balearica TaxID=44012 RepID=UPI001C990A25|nr:hypothetical protein [Ferrimonas balearica]MBY5920408.1 hypothetical protein [Ferrimonas balearica]MBY5996907.1 hypothetical protein [Ferrimonas balearica]
MKEIQTLRKAVADAENAGPLNALSQAKVVAAATLAALENLEARLVRLENHQTGGAHG